MALTVILIRKMMQNKWLVLSLFLGILITVALVSSMPIYSEAILSRMLKKDLEQLQLRSGAYPGAYYGGISFSNETSDEINAKFDEIDGYMRGTAAPGFRLPLQELVTDLVSVSLNMKRADDPSPPTSKNLKAVVLKAYSGFQEHIRLKDGRMPAEGMVDGVYEVLATERALNRYGAVLGDVFTVADSKVAADIKLRPVGLIEKKRDDDPYFRYGNLSDMNNSFIMPFGLAEEHLLRYRVIPLLSAGWYFIMDYSKMELRHAGSYTAMDEAIRSKLLRHVSMYHMTTDAKALETIASYDERAKRLRTFMWALNVPMLIMLGFYMLMIANLIAGRQKNEIAVIRSRGAARWQIIAASLLEGMLLGGAALAAGPWLGVALTELLGASSGFLEFVQRVRLPVRLTGEAYLYGAMAAGACIAVTIVPVIIATRATIVSHKRQAARLTGSPLWHKLFLDIIALGLALYGLYTFRGRMDDMQELGLRADDLALDPLQFVVPALFIIGAGLLLLRLYPFALRLVFWLGKRWWPPSMYAMLINVGRSGSQYQFLMVFLIMTIATGVFSASAARTINGNTEDRIRYAGGADVTLSVNWVNDAPPPAAPGEESAGAASSETIHYAEPPFEPFRELPGVEQAARVFVKPNAGFFANEEFAEATLMAIDTDEFGRTAWFRHSLMDYHLNEYLNLLAADSSAVLISGTLAEQKGVGVGDTIWIGWQEVTQQPYQVYGIIDYFPTFNPLPATASGEEGEEGNAKDKAPMLIVAHLPDVQVRLALEPYDIWLKLAPDASTKELYDVLAEKKMAISNLANTREQLTAARNDPFLLALNGVLTLGFMLSVLVSFAGFLLYWVLSLRGRTLQNGILRAIGLSLRNLIAMLAAEQILTSGVAVLLGIVVGNAASLLYVQSFQIAFHPASLVPPFMVRIEGADLLRITVIVGCMLLIGLGLLACMLSRLRIHQALKLGEDEG
ncbi:ABC transporter permease [Paenibacillus sp. J5C_2022]|uniref:ABC transporter permease n=1 Tax=Paenibacillus sp. J5C2022 TaxID=2977129 RepID=UPI0021D0F150|nr:ABC transporter permease [Paenibacillus sp. J5C2022]MCU6712932.1 ABC transporter permease [Paenibacillus sp. J5C2022]